MIFYLYYDTVRLWAVVTHHICLSYCYRPLR